MRAIILCAWLGLASMGSSALAEGLRFAFEPALRFGSNESFHVLSMRGEIEAGDADRFSRFVLDNPERFVADGERVAFVIDGGDVLEALRLGELLRDALMTAWVPDASRARCVSACFFLFAHCVSRHAAPESIGLHRPYFEARALASASPEAVRRRYQQLESELRARMMDLAVPITLLETMQKLPAGEVYRLSAEDLARLGGSQSWFDDYLAARCAAREDSSPTGTSSCREELLRQHRRQFVEHIRAAAD
jgi:hypothetical protein